MTATRPGQARPSWAHRSARLTTEVFAPWVVVTTLPLAIAWHAVDSALLALGWGLLVATFGAAIPMAVIVRGARTGRWDGHHVSNRAGRLVPLLVCVTSVTTALALLLLLGAPQAMVALDVAMLATVAAIVAVTRWWKISAHTSVSGGAVIIAALAYGPVVLAAVPLVALIGWSRVVLDEHTVAQVGTGILLGAVVAGATYTGLR